MATVTLPVSGMKCDACENLIHDALMEKEGVLVVKADHQAKTVEVEYDESKVDLDTLKQTIVDQGFRVIGYGESSLLDRIRQFFDALLKFFRS